MRPYHTHKLNFRSQECLFLGYSSSHKGYKCLSLFGRIYVSKDVLFNELRFPYFDLFPSSSNSIKSLDSYFSLNPNLSPPFVVCVPQSSQLSPSHSPFAPLAPPIPIHSPTTSLLVSHPSTSSESTSIHPQTSESTTLSAPSFDSVSAPNSILVNTHLCKQDPCLEFTILDYILLYFLLILNLKL